MSFSLNGILSLSYILFIGISSAFLFCLAVLIRILTLPFDRKLLILHLFTSFWASLYTWCMPLWSVTIFGREKMDSRKNYVIVSNHQSQLDILVLYRLFFPFRWVSKAEVFRLPFIGWNMSLNGYIKLKRGERSSVEKMMQECRDLLEKGISVFFFPEGTRSETGRVKPFKPGAFILAKEMKKPILPIVLNHTKDALPKHSLEFHGRHNMEVRVLDEIPYSELEHIPVPELADRIRDLIASHVSEHMAN
ncbi:lysophospholipid acyltransferase family protein [Desulfospira joergensenii]|uniref:lysophospholipid acyltransferase family protein n=1 Tax=Desulfospira joergensenii TaxID=53329 RepID=UPI0003B42886|nr:lysophospholipid acyltransferase family protein [Desulfospira joergensenii]